MLAVSNGFNEAFRQDYRDIKMRIKINDITYTDSDIISFNYNAGSIVGESFAIGSTFANTIKLTLCKIVEGLKQLDEVIPEMGIVLPNGSTEWVKLGTFIISEEVNPDRNENRTSIECTDKMIMLDDIYESKLNYPAKIRDVALEIANLAGVEVEPVSFGRLMENTIQKPVGYTYRQALGLIAQFEAGYACFDRNGLLAIRQLEDKDYQVTPNEYFQNGLTKNELKFRPAGIQVKVSDTSEDDKVLKIGNEKGSVIRLENKVMTEQLLRLVYDKVKNINYYPYTLKWRGNPAVEVGDWLQVTDTKGNLFKVPNLSYSFEYKGGLTATSTVETVASNEVRFGYKGILDQTVEYVENALKDVGGNLIYYGVEAPPSPKEGDTWFKYVDSDTEIWVYEKISEPDVFDWVFKISSAVDNSIKEKIDELEQQSKDQQINIDKALSDAEKAREEAEVARQEAFDSSTIAKQAEKDALDALLKGDQNSTQITTLEGQQKLTNTKVEGNTANILSLQTDSEKLSLSIGKVQADVENLDLTDRNLLLNSSFFKNINGWAEDGAKASWLDSMRMRVVFEGGRNNRVYHGGTLESIEVGEMFSITFKAFSNTDTKIRIGSNDRLPAPIIVNNNSGVLKEYRQDGIICGTTKALTITGDVGTIIQITDIMIVRGNKSRIHQLAPEDLTTKTEFSTFEASVKGFQTSVNSDIDKVKSEQTQMAGQITSLVTETTPILSIFKDKYLKSDRTGVMEGGSWYTSNSTGEGRVWTNQTGSRNRIYFDSSYMTIQLRTYMYYTIRFRANASGNVPIEIGFSAGENLKLTVGDDGWYTGTIKSNQFTALSIWIPDVQSLRIRELHLFESSTGISSSQVIQLHDQITQTVNKVETVDGKVTSQQTQITQLSNNINLKVDKDNAIAQINLSPESIRLDAKFIHLSGTSKIDDAIIKSAMIDTVSANKLSAGTIDANIIRVINVEAENIVGNEIRGISLTSIDNQGYFNVRGNKAVLQNTSNNRRIEMSDTGIYVYNQNGTLRGELSQSIVNTGLVGTNTYNVYVGTGGSDGVDGESEGGELRVVRYDSTPGDGSVASYRYRPVRAEGFVGNYVNVNTPLNGPSHLYLRPRYGVGEVRVTASGTIDYYHDLRARSFFGNTLDINSSLTGDHIYIRPSANGEVRFTMTNTTDVLRDFRGGLGFIESISQSKGTNFYIGTDGEARITSRSLATSGTVYYRDIRAANFITNSQEGSKQNIRELTTSALDVIESATIYNYQLKSELSENIDREHVGLVIGLGYQTPQEVVQNGGINQYAMNSLAWKAIQELNQKIFMLEEKLKYANIA